MKSNHLIILIFLLLPFTKLWSQSAVPAYDAAMISIQSPGYTRPGESFIIKGIFKNNGTVRINDLLISWQVDGGDVHTYKKTGMDLSKSIRESFEHPTPLQVTQNSDFTLKVWVSEPNGQEDLKHKNDTLSKTIQVVSEFPEKNFLIEEATGTWCGWCPRGPIAFRDDVKPNHPNTILVALHNGDDMAINDGNTVVQTYITAFPSGMVNRRNPGNYAFGMSTNEWNPAIGMMDQDFTPVDINVYNYYNPVNYEWKIDVVVDFIIDYSGSLRLNCYVVEDSVTGTGSGYNQANYYNTRNDIPELHGIGNPIIGYSHNHVVREMLGGPWGQAGIIPSKAKKGDRYIFSRTIKAQANKWHMNQVHLVGIIQAYNSNKDYRPIINVKEVDVSLATGFEEPELSSSLRIYPNPVSDMAILEFSNAESGKCNVQILNINGQIIRSYDFLASEGRQIMELNCGSWSQGMYFIRWTVNNETKTQRLLKSN